MCSCTAATRNVATTRTENSKCWQLRGAACKKQEAVPMVAKSAELRAQVCLRTNPADVSKAIEDSLSEIQVSKKDTGSTIFIGDV